MPRSLKLPQPKSPPGMKVGPDGAQRSIATDPTLEALPKVGRAGGEVVTVSFPNYEQVDWSSRPSCVVQGWYRDVRRTALAGGGTIQYDEPTVEFVTVMFGSRAMATRFCRKLVEESEMDPRKIDATVRQAKGAEYYRARTAVKVAASGPSLKSGAPSMTADEIDEIRERFQQAESSMGEAKAALDGQVEESVPGGFSIRGLFLANLRSVKGHFGNIEAIMLKHDYQSVRGPGSKTGAGMTKMHFIAVAKALAAIPDAAVRSQCGEALVGVFAGLNPRFDKERFMAAVNGGAGGGQVVATRRLGVDLTRYVVTAEGHVVFAAENPFAAEKGPKGPPKGPGDKPHNTSPIKAGPASPEIDESMETEADPHHDVEKDDDAPKPGDEVLVISLDAAQIGTLQESHGEEGEQDGTVVVQLEDGPVETEHGAIRKLKRATVPFGRMPAHLLGRGMPVRMGSVETTLHRVVTAEHVEVMLPQGPRRVEAARLTCPIKMADLGVVSGRAREAERADFMETLRAAGHGRQASVLPGSGIRFR